MGEKLPFLVEMNVIASFSTIGVFLVIVTLLRLGHLRKIIAFKMILFVTINDFGYSFLYLLSNYTIHHPDSIACEVQGVGINYFRLCSIAWTCCAAVTIYCVFASAKELKKFSKFLDQKRMMWVFLIVAQICPIGPSLVPYLVHAHEYGPAGIWCWVKEDFHLRLFAYYIWMWIGCVFTAAVYIRTVRLVSDSKQTGTTTPTKRRSSRNRLTWKTLKYYPVIFLLLHIPATINRIYQGSTGKKNTFLSGLHIFASCSLGTWNAVLFFSNPRVRQEILVWYRGLSMSSARKEVLLDSAGRSDKPGIDAKMEMELGENAAERNSHEDVPNSCEPISASKGVLQAKSKYSKIADDKSDSIAID